MRARGECLRACLTIPKRTRPASMPDEGVRQFKRNGVRCTVARFRLASETDRFTNAYHQLANMFLR
jgi:hypothetical protein